MSLREVIVQNNLTRSRSPLITQKEGEVKFYSCGPTTYDFAHIGNGRSFVTADLFHRVLKSFGYKVNFVRNYTDVDDKIINRARELGRDPIEHAAIFVKECEKDMASLGMLPPTHTPKVSESMPEIIKMIEDIISNKKAYPVEGGDVYFDVASFPNYGMLSKKDLDSLQHGSRVEVDGRKKNPGDFALWKAAKPGEPAWDSPWGKGRPGWHIECSAMAKKFLGNTLDLHHGGVDLMFPHHENEIAQSEAANNCRFCNSWAHNEFLNFGTEKMSKSLGNVVRIRDFVEKYSGAVLRTAFLSAHYRTPLVWSDEFIKASVSNTRRIHETYKLLKDFISAATEGSKKSEEFDIEQLATIKNQFEHFQDALAHDFNSAGAISNLFELVRLIRKALDQHQMSLKLAQGYLQVLQDMNEATGLIYVEKYEEVLAKLDSLDQDVSSSGIDPAWIEQLIIQRKEAKTQKNWARADEIRKELAEKKISLKDNPDGTVSWKVDT